MELDGRVVVVKGVASDEVPLGVLLDDAEAAFGPVVLFCANAGTVTSAS